MKKYLFQFLLILLLAKYSQAQTLPVNSVMNHKGVNGINVVFNPSISASSPYVLCGGTSTLTLNANPFNASYTYQWSFSSTEAGIYSNISGATTSSFTTNSSYHVGYYKVAINDGTTPALSPAFKVRQGATVTLINVSPSSISLGSSTTLNMTFTGTGPWYYFLNMSSESDSKWYSTNTPTTSLSITPNSDTFFRLYEDIFDSEGVGCRGVYPTLDVRVNPAATLTLGNPTSSSVCPGSILEIPVTYGGTLGNTNNINVTAYLANNSGSISGSYQSGLNGASLKYVIPPETPNGSYKINAYGNQPFFPLVSTSNTFTVVNSGCTVNKPVINSKSTGCSSLTLLAYPIGSGYNYQWYKNNVAIAGAVSSIYNLFSNTDNGSYKVSVSNISLGFNGTSDPKSITVLSPSTPSVTKSGTTACNPVILSTNYTGSGYTYQWFSNFTDKKRILIGETNPTVTVNSPGSYYVSIWDGNCQTISNYQTINPCPTCPTTLSLVSTANDYTNTSAEPNGILLKQVNSTIGTISATNKVTGTAKVTYRAGKSITLDAGFKADNGTVFKTEFGGCN
jgi:large repetitive protein